MKKYQKIKFLLTGLTVMSPLLIAASCNDKQPSKPGSETPQNPTPPESSKPLDKQGSENPIPPANGNGSTNGTDTTVTINYFNDNETKEFIKNKDFNTLFDYSTRYPFNSKTAQEYLDNIDEYLTITAKEPRLKFRVLNHSENNNEITLFMNFNDNDDINQFFTLRGFKVDNTPKLQNPNSRPSANEEVNYFNSSNLEKYEKDIKALLSSIKSQQYARSTNINLTKKQEFNEKAKKLGLPDYDTMNDLGWTVPEYDTTGNSLVGLNIKKTSNSTLNSWVDWYGKDQYKNVGLARTLTNEHYVNIAHQTFQTSFNRWLYSDNESERNTIAQLLKNDEDLKLLANKITDEQKKQEILGKIKSDSSHGVLERYRMQIWEELVKQNNNDHEKAAVIYTEYVKNQREKLKQRVNANNTLSEITKQTVLRQIDKAENFTNLENSSRNQVNGNGTSFILDYELAENGKYPTKFYFATNYHVVDGFDENNISGFGLTRLDKQYPSLFSTLKVNFLEDKINTFSLPKKAFKRIMDGRDFFNWDPNSFSTDKSNTTKEFLDIAIFEVDFSKLSGSNELYGKSTPEEFAQYVTNDYANLPENKKLSLPTYDYLSSHDKIDVPIIKNQKDKKPFEEYDQLYGVSYPATSSNGFLDFYLDQYEDAYALKNAKNTFSLWTNADYNLYKSAIPQDQEKRKRLERGNHLSHSVILRTFKEKHGVYDRFLSAPVVGKTYVSNDDGKPYYQSGLAYLYKGYAPGGGASGSSVRNQRNELVGLVTTAYLQQVLTSGLAIRSQGFDFENLFNGYNLPQYDVVYGGGKDQAKSFRETIKSLYPNKRTWLFKEGLDTIPEKYQFTANK
ncbi:Ig-specific serine endopeptidase MIP [Mycoplasmopsis felis]|uniref:Ig-specific serine endopeptidase MIP n=1 Tax=Mycoplasmopsis felis TaxID=33923 RepID=UPI00068BF8D5|nr:DUF31 family protein [Mycoplasmopsis felis]